MFLYLRICFSVVLWALVQMSVMAFAVADDSKYLTAEDEPLMLMDTSDRDNVSILQPMAEVAQTEHQHQQHLVPQVEETLEPVEFEPHQAHDSSGQPAGLISPQDMMMIEMMRSGSGTGWQPMDNPLLMQMNTFGSWMTMLHWSAFLDYTNQGGPRGRSRVVSQNWAMASAMRPMGQRAIVQFRGMFSAEPLTVGRQGYPLLFQTGETFRGQSLIDYQHPHDLFMELSAQVLYQFTPNTWFRFYGAPVGEPALGPVAYPHRYSALKNPDAVLSHHMQDATHISFGVLTAGLIHRNWQLEGSLFNGREPDESRYDFDFGPLDSYATRLSYMPNRNWAMQASYGFLREPEALEPGNAHRLTSSIQHIRTTNTGWWATTLAFGHNFMEGSDENGVVLESTLNFRERNYIYGRLENVYKHGLFEDHDEAHESFNITAFTLGVARDLLQFRGIPLTLGSQITVHAKPSRLNEAYGDFPISFHIYLHTNAPRHRMQHSHVLEAVFNRRR
jgi:hypothetical protein